ncbi:hypothetical protein FOA43_000265 [Brettanomyces nanus]|uniref:Purine-cytosine permease n=1 Tax=Eeniella nana TaxID=13502 RepID=A0A875RVJ5_EENNA|nr:uncharacterized protein FOA43_000265 [Brettanomyces nanus]QPG72961.1 hypothetical protein FOA43_000265 [Brettanomyces nanus]
MSETNMEKNAHGNSLSDTDKTYFSQQTAEVVVCNDESKSGFSSVSRSFKAFSAKLDALGAEARGIERVPPEERDYNMSKLNMFFLWCSGTGSLTSASGFFLGPILLGLSLKDSMISGLFGACFGALVAAFTSTLGPKSGLRQMVGSRFFFGWYFSRFCSLLNFISVCGFSVINCVFGGQILNAISHGKCPIEIGIVIISVLSGIVAIVGIRFVHKCEKYMSVPLLIFFLLTFICAGKDFDNFTPSVGDSVTVAGNCLSFFAVCFGINAGWGSIASDYYILFPEKTSSWLTFSVTFVGIFVPSAFVGSLAICIASAWLSNPAYQTAYDNYGNGGLLKQALSRWNGGGDFILVILFLSLFTNNILNLYSMPLSVQVIHSFFFRLPRWFLTVVGFIICLVCSVCGRNTLSNYLNNFLPMIGYWIIIFGTIIFEEMIFRGSKSNFNWADWNTKDKLTHGYAASFAFCCGAAGAVVGMCQAYYIGPIAIKIGEYGGDVAIWCSLVFTGVAYPPCRILEKKYFKR